MNTKYSFSLGKDMEARVGELLEAKNIRFKGQVSLTEFDLRTDFFVPAKGFDFAIEVSQRNSNEDIQRICFRTSVYKNFTKTPVKTIIIVPNFSNSWKSLRLFMFLLKFSDMFLFSEDLDRLGQLICNPNLFSDYTFAKLGIIHPESETLLKALKDGGIITHEELAKTTGIKLNNIKKLFYQNHLSLEKLGMVERLGNYCRLNARFLEK